ncbi:hypothetical protein SISNIDRAFT_496462 [Sistotremastrum niveocremeum HHB9708]|uniref:Extracellular membrane protein CFEM domain-containing protein n=1 Tax=Sistotremastrum niveocremeum HHB9708 TaxID=1314777 RepID=A0A164SJQ5_9AGAM|nr:hypothetical protein SISNIDRAFT_496462 [Sistotremastrum niveocremeum HHB9708]
MLTAAVVFAVLAGSIATANAEPILLRRQTAANPFGTIPDSCNASCQPLIDAYTPCFQNGQEQPSCLCTNANLGKAADCAQCLVDVNFASESDEQQALGFVAQACAAEGVSTPTLVAGGSPTGSVSETSASSTDTATESLTTPASSSTGSESPSTVPTSTATSPATSSTGSTSSSGGSSGSSSSSSKSSSSSSSAPAATTSTSGAKGFDAGFLVSVGAAFVGVLSAVF